MTALIFLDPQLHTPMYFLLSQLSLMYLMYFSSTVPKMVYNFLSGQKSISFLGCGVQSFFFLTMAGSEGLILAYACFVAICHPLHYLIRMSKRTGVKMIIGTWILGSISSLAHTVYALHFPYCRSRVINHFYCDIPAMLPLACVDTWVYEYMVFVRTVVFLLVPFLGITASMDGSLYSPAEDKNLAVFYTILTPMLNPIIYSLRNKEVLGGHGKSLWDVLPQEEVSMAVPASLHHFFSCKLQSSAD
ncbi:olfactory receptor 2L13-like [Callospermophilus lateralis]|uniref:olfactory receptor 2L13-like n=1 Tax=Callospermophilus lateralis TaxID=76772 RepID=UPI00405400F0